ncbi:hypothetical protein BV898_14959 [Hypsibius exemplaris]|uniref:Uncharacterized protein n=1 Tax=Hypsibius exemplaris TaxID=2072580 RepID=A0A9X6N9S8_HYPEX|nr:hypothetical protein BV898_14959 [Hypsibius exemplaris]
MSDIHYDTRTGAVMAGGNTGSGHKAGAVVKQQLAAIRAACIEARNKSNQDLILLLENYNDQISLVVESLRSGDAEKTTGGWETTTSKKGKGNGKSKKASESDAGGHALESGSVSGGSNSKVSAHLPAPPKVEQKATKAKPNSLSVTEPEIHPQGKDTTERSPPAFSNGKHKNHLRIPNMAEQEQITIVKPKDVPIPDIHGHTSSFTKLLTALSETHATDLKNLELGVEHLRRTLDQRHEELQRSLHKNHQDALRNLDVRHHQGMGLVSRVAQSSSLSPQEYSQWQQDITSFTADYKVDLHLATSAKFNHSTDEAILHALRNYGSVASIPPASSYQFRLSLSSTDHRRGNMTNGVSDAKAVGLVPTVSSTSTHAAEKWKSHQQNVTGCISQPKQTFSGERVTIVPNKGLAPSSSAPLSSLVISGGNLTAEEMASLTQSLQNSLHYPIPVAPTKPLGAIVDGGDTFSTSDIFSGSALCWTNSNQDDQWPSSVAVEEKGVSDGIGPIGAPNLSVANSATRRGTGSRGGHARGARGGNGNNRGRGPSRAGGVGYRGNGQ